MLETEQHAMPPWWFISTCSLQVGWHMDADVMQSHHGTSRKVEEEQVGGKRNVLGGEAKETPEPEWSRVASAAWRGLQLSTSPRSHG